ncbi:MAG: hypothetical protein ACRCUY_05570 [Thermoguttaceae bacterium]
MTFENILTNSAPIEGFSVMKMKQDVQEQIYRETKGMDAEELIEYFRQGSERFRAKSSNTPLELRESVLS